MNTKLGEGFQSNQSVERALDILELLSNNFESLSAIEISKRLKINRTTTYGLLNTLLKKKYINKDSSGAKFSVSTRLFELGSNYPHKMPLALLASPYMTELLYRHDVSVHFAIHYEIGKAMIVTAKIPARSAVVRLGQSIPMHASAIGKVMLAFLPKEQLDEIINSYDLYRCTPTTITNKEDLIAELEQIRIQGFAIDRGEQFNNTNCVGFPVRDSSNRVVAALSFSDNTDRIKKKQNELIRDGLQCCKYLSMELGWQPMKQGLIDKSNSWE
jgi:DNA-binding IclR family transcriptional regulator